MDNLSISGYPLTDNNGLYLYFVPEEIDAINIVIPKPKNGKITPAWYNKFTGETVNLDKMDWQLFKGFSSPWGNTSAVLVIK